jgi:RNA polymerase sigma factor for flagellar operon FliA
MQLTETAIRQLAETHRSYAHAISSDILRKLPAHIEKSDVQACAELGLMEAARAFDSRPGVQFKTFAYYRIRGAIYDGLRKASWFSRGQYKDFQFERAANDYMTDCSEAAASPVVTMDELEHHATSIVTCYMLSLESSDVAQPADKRRSQEEELLAKEAQARLLAAVPKLPEKNRRVIEAYYFEGRNLDEIGAEMGLSKSWTCRIHAKALEMLRGLLEDAPPRKATFSQAVR